ncbi:hypothetical protein AC249_AIPGENE27769 [Exaiptasia diaphana]|nr:hypothetical protein AC249_AIPGENE27769 [Exaiptasia diaphana]
MYDQSTLKPIGQTKLYCTVKGITKKVQFQVVKDAPISLLSGKACQALQLLNFSEDILQINESLTKEQVLTEYADVFTGLGKLPGVYHIETDPNVKPVQGNPRRVALPLEEELKQKIGELEQMEVLAKVTEPTPWISNMVAIKTPKKLRSAIRGYHVYKYVWTPSIGSKLSALRESDNKFDRFAVKIVLNAETVGHLPREYSRIAWYFIARGGVITVEVKGQRRRSKGTVGGMEVPCLVTFTCSRKSTINKLKDLLQGKI